MASSTMATAVEIDQFLGKKYRLKSSENFEEYLKFIEVGMISRKTACGVKPIVVLKKNSDGSYTFTMSTVFRCTKTTFKPGEEFVEERADGIKVKSIITLEGTDMIQIQIEDNGRTSKHIRKYTPTTLTVITTAEGWDGTCTRIYELLEENF